MATSRVTSKDLLSAREKTSIICACTPLIHSVSLSEQTGADVFIKLESLQPTGSYKVRGAANKLLSLSPEQSEKGVVAYSTGNHGLAVAYVARELGIRAVICVSEKVSADRLDAIRKYDAEVWVRGEDQDHAGLFARQLQKEQGLELVHPFDDPHVIAGQGTIGLEIIENIEGLGSVIVPLAGGGLASGVGLAIKSMYPDVRVIGASARNLPSMVLSLQAGEPVEVEERESVARSLEGEIGTDNRHTFAMVKQLVDQTLLVTEGEIESAIDFMIVHEGLIIEGAAAAAVASILENRVAITGAPIVVVISGGNLDQDLFLQAAMRIHAHVA